MRRDQLKVGLVVPADRFNVSVTVIAITEHSVIYYSYNPEYFESIERIENFLKKELSKKIEITLVGFLNHNHTFREIDSRYFKNDFLIISERKIMIEENYGS
jgi:hypothetical protein